MRAITTYDQGLSKHPTSFDLAYNKYARSILFPEGKYIKD